MSKTTLLFVLLLTLFAYTGEAATVVVVGTCQKGVQFGTIQAAVDAVAPMGTVLVCPGIYPEQVVVRQPLTLRGLVNNNKSEAVIVPPAGGLVENSYGLLVGNVATQLLVEDSPGPVTITNIAVDGAGAICPSRYWVGIGFQNSVGSINATTVRNVTSFACKYGTAVGIGWHSNVTVKNSSVRDCYYGIGADRATNLTVSSNMVSRCSHCIAAGSMAGPVTVSSNIISEIRCGDDPCQYLAAGTGIQVGGNHAFPSTVSNNVLYGSSRNGTGGAVGIAAVQSDNVRITGNRVTTAYNGINLFETTGAVVQGNTISDTASALNLSDNGVGGANIITNNIIRDSLCGFWAPTTPANTMQNVKVINCYGMVIPPE